MKSYSLRFLFNLTLLFQAFCFIIYLIGILPFYFPHIAILFAVLCNEKKFGKRLTFLLINLFLFSQFAESFPFIFIALLFAQLYLFNMMMQEVTTFDMPLIALFSAIMTNAIINANHMIYQYVSTGKFFIINFSVCMATTTAILLFIFIYYKEYINHMYIRDSWL